MLAGSFASADLFASTDLFEVGPSFFSANCLKSSGTAESPKVSARCAFRFSTKASSKPCTPVHAVALSACGGETTAADFVGAAAGVDLDGAGTTVGAGFGAESTRCIVREVCSRHVQVSTPSCECNVSGRRYLCGSGGGNSGGRGRASRRVLRANFGLHLGQRGLALQFLLLGLGLGGLCALPLDLVHLGSEGLCLGFEFGEAPLDFFLVGHHEREHDALLFVNLDLVWTLLQRHVHVTEEGLVRVEVQMRVPEIVADANYDVLAWDAKGLTRALVEALLVRRRISVCAR